jgi:diguanylate cyclase (GGDEF)-like protein/PAS domain S-box-containing protein
VKPRFRSLLILALTLPMLAAGSLVGWLSFSNTERAVNDLADKFRHEVIGNVTADLNAHLAGVQRVVELNARQGWDLSDLKGLQRRLFNQLLAFQTPTQIAVGTTERAFVGVERRQDDKVMLSHSDLSTGYGLNTYAATRHGEPHGYSVSVPDYDPRQQIWYRSAEKAPGTIWTDPFYYPGEKTLRIAAAHPAFDAIGQFSAVYVAAMNLEKTSRFLRELSLAGGARVFIIDRKGLLIASSLDEPLIRDESLFDRLPAVESRDAVVRKIADRIRTAAAFPATPFERQEMRIEDDKDVHYVEARPYRFDEGIEWLVVVAIPESGLIGHVKDGNSTTMFLLLALTLPALGLAILIAHWIDVPVSRLSQAAEAIASGRLDESIEITQPRELASLGESFNAMTARLRKSFAALEQSKQRLEERVIERTRELNGRNSALIEEIHRREAAEHGIRRERDFTRRVINSLPGIFFLVDEDGQDVLWNTNLETVTGYGGEELASMSLFSLFDANSRIAQGHAECEAIIVARDGRRIPFHIKGECIEMDSSPHVIGMGVDITQRKRLEDELRRLATTDALTGAATRGHFFDSAELEIERTHRYQRPLSVMMLDIDHFKSINDSHGHAAGDTAIQKVVGVLKQLLRGEDLVGRLGGEEFGVLLPETDSERAVIVAERIREQISALHIVNGENRISLTVSIGVTEYQRFDTGIDALLLRADLALYSAKHGGRNRTVLRIAAQETEAA